MLFFTSLHCLYDFYIPTCECFSIIPLLFCILLLLLFHKTTCLTQVKTKTHFKYYKLLFPVLYQLTEVLAKSNTKEKWLNLKCFTFYMLACHVIASSLNLIGS